MILSEKGYYYSDLALKNQYDNDFHQIIVSKLLPKPNESEGNERYIEYMDGNIFEFTKEFTNIKVKSSLTEIITILKIYPLELFIESPKENIEEIYVFSKEQFEQILKYNEIMYPAVNSMILTDELKTAILSSDFQMDKLKITNIPLIESFNEKKETKNVFSTFSKYIDLYMKSNFDPQDFPENNYSSKKNFSIGKDEDLYY